MKCVCYLFMFSKHFIPGYVMVVLDFNLGSQSEAQSGKTLWMGCYYIIQTSGWEETREPRGAHANTSRTLTETRAQNHNEGTVKLQSCLRCHHALFFFFTGFIFYISFHVQ